MAMVPKVAASPTSKELSIAIWLGIILSRCEPRYDAVCVLAWPPDNPQYHVAVAFAVPRRAVIRFTADGSTQIRRSPLSFGCRPLAADRMMRLHAQTAVIENGFVHLPDEAHWLAGAVSELDDAPGRLAALTRPMGAPTGAALADGQCFRSRR
jgi:hypothetical protein